MPAGDNARLIELGEVSAKELHRTARAYDGIAHIVGHSSIYVFPEIRLDTTRDRVTPTHREIRVCFDGIDLPELLARVPREEFFARIPTLKLTARYLGFRGGFAYLDGWPEEWSMPRRPTSRARVARGTFAIGGAVAGFYSIDTPGGWNQLGHTDEDLEHALTPGDTITLKVVDELPFPSPRKRGEGQGEGPFLKRITPPDYANLARGLPPGGPFDAIAARLATKALERCEILYECAMRAPRLTFDQPKTVAWCTPDLHVNVYRLEAGEPLNLGRITGGLRAYLAVGNGEGTTAHFERKERNIIHAMPGPHDLGIRDIECEVTPQLDRVGIRLRPLHPIDAHIPADLRSIGMQFGTVQLHPDGTLVAMGPDHPVTGGYLQPMTVITSERWKLGQLVPGERVSFRTDIPTARRRETPDSSPTR